MTDYLEEIKDRHKKLSEALFNTDVLEREYGDIASDDIQYLIRRLEEREHTVKLLRDEVVALKTLLRSKRK